MPLQILPQQHLKICFFFIFGCTGSPCRVKPFSRCGELGAPAHCSEQSSHCGGFSHCGAPALLRSRFSSCSFQAPERVLGSCGTWVVGPRHVGSSHTRDRTSVPSIGRQLLIHCATREVPKRHFYSYFAGRISLFLSI